MALNSEEEGKITMNRKSRVLMQVWFRGVITTSLPTSIQRNVHPDLSGGCDFHIQDIDFMGSSQSCDITLCTSKS